METLDALSGGFGDGDVVTCAEGANGSMGAGSFGKISFSLQADIDKMINTSNMAILI